MSYQALLVCGQRWWQSLYTLPPAQELAGHLGEAIPAHTAMLGNPKGRGGSAPQNTWGAQAEPLTKTPPTGTGRDRERCRCMPSLDLVHTLVPSRE